MNRRLFAAWPLLVATFLIAAMPANALDIKRVTSPRGQSAWLVEDHSVPVISIDFSFRGGAANDPVGKEGRAEMVSSLLDEGAGNLKSQAFQKALEEISASLRFRAGLDRFSGTLRTLSVYRDRAFDLLRLAVSAPRFDPEAVERIRTQILVSLKQDSENPRRIAGRKWFETVFGQHPYARPVSGTEKSVLALTIADLRRFAAENLARDGLVIGVAGDITPAELGPMLDRVFGELPKQTRRPRVSEAQLGEAGRTVVVRKSIPQSVVVFGQKGVKRDDPDYYAAYVMNQILGGGGFSSRLTEQVREKRGLAYSVYSYLNPLDHAGLILGGLATQNAKVAKSIEIVRAEWRRFARDGVTERELENAKTYINGSFPLRLDSSRRIAGMLVAIQVSHLGIDYVQRRPRLISAVTREDIRRVARRLLADKALTVVIVGDPQGLKTTN